jgi:hypothetical protein
MAVELVTGSVFTGEREGASQRESERERRESWRGWLLQGVFSAAWAANRRWPQRAPGCLHAPGSCLNEEDKEHFAESPLGI